jgi:hypothetical protein
MRVKHSKIKNTGILFELLVRKVASDVLDGKTDSFAVRIMKEHFHSKSELGKELQLYRAFFNTPVLSEAKAFNMLELVIEKRKTLNEKLLAAQKFLLIKEIKEHSDLKQFTSGRVPSYKVYASIYKLFELATTAPVSTDMMQIEEIVKSRFLLVEHLKGELKEEQIIKESNYAQMLRSQPEEIRHLSYKFLLERFNEKYSVFSDKQKSLLREYINNGTDIDKFGKFVSHEAKTLSLAIKRHASKISDNVTKIKINEVLSQLGQIEKRPAVKDNYITALLIAYQISHELESLS